MTDLSDGIDAIYENRKKFIIIGLTGRTGSGCSSAARILSESIENITLPKAKLCGDGDDRKYKIIYDFAQNNWEKFHWIQIKDVITSFILDNSFSDFEEFVSDILANGSTTKEQIKEQLRNAIKEQYTLLYTERDKLNTERKELESASIIEKDKIESRREIGRASCRERV